MLYNIRRAEAPRGLARQLRAELWRDQQLSSRTQLDPQSCPTIWDILVNPMGHVTHMENWLEAAVLCTPFSCAR